MAEPYWDPAPLLLGTVVVLAIERVVELVVSHRNIARLRAENIPHAAASSSLEYAAMVLVHVLFLACPLLLLIQRTVSPTAEMAIVGVTAIAAAQLLRWWTIRTLGLRWNARAIVAPSLGAVHTGPYRFMRHPNYLAVTIEFAALPLAFGAWKSGALIFAANAVLLVRRIRQEERLLAKVPGWREGFAR